MATATKRITKKAARAELARRKLDHTTPEFKARPANVVLQLKGWQLREIIATPVRTKA